MIKRTLEISREPAHLAVRHRQLELRRGDEVVGSIPCEDLGMVVVDHPQTTYSHAALVELMEQDTVVILCGRDHLPCGIVLPLADHNQVVWRIKTQIDLTAPLRKRVWQQLVRAKILAQADNLQRTSVAGRRLREFATTVRSGDPDNREAQAAKVYWSAWLMEAPEAVVMDSFRRDPEATGLNTLLNYGYAVVRAAIARAIIAAGLHPALGVHHSSRGNAFCLADDLIEPLRPFVDSRVRQLAFAGENELTQLVKASLLSILTDEVQTGDFSGPLMVALHRYVSSLVKVFEGNARDLEIPVPCNSAATAACGS